MSTVSKGAYRATHVLVLCVVVVCIYVIFSRFYLRFDATEDNIYTLSEGSLNISKKLPEHTVAQLFYSRSVKDAPVVIKTYGNRVEEVLREYSARSGGKLAVEVVDPKPDTDEEESARKYGINAIRLPSGEDLYLGILFTAGDREVVLPYLDPRKEEFLEYDLSEAMVKLVHKEKPKLGLMSSLELSGGPQGREWAVVQGLRNLFDVEIVKVGDDIPQGMNVLVVIHPKEFSDAAYYAIDQFVMRGGRLIVAVDPFSRQDLAANQQAMMQGQMSNAASDFNKLFQAWGLIYNPGEIVGDGLRATRINTGSETLHYPFFLTLEKDDFAAESKVTGHLKQILMAEAGALALKEGSGHKFEPLVATSSQSGVVGAAMAGYMGPVQMAASFKEDGKKRIMAGLLTGQFKSAFSVPPEGVASGEYRPQAEKEGAVMVIADVDFMHDSNAIDAFNFGFQTIIRPRNDNLNLVLNAAEFLGGNEDLISIRSSGKVARPFTKVMELQADAQKRWQAEEERLSAELSSLQKKLGELQARRTDANRALLSPQQEAEIKRFREEEASIRRRRREVRKNLREDIENLGHRLVVANLFVVPLLVSGFGVGVFVGRERRRKKEKHHA